MSEPLRLDPTKKVTHFVAVNVALALRDPNTNWRRIGVIVRTLDDLIDVNSQHGQFAGAKQLTELRDLLKQISEQRARDRLVNMFEKFKSAIQPFSEDAGERRA